MKYSIPSKGIGLTAAIAGLLAFAPVASAIEVDLTGHVDRMVRAADNDGVSDPQGNNNAGSDIQHLDNGADQSRLQLLGLQEMNDGEAGVDIEMRISDTSECYDIKQKTAGGGSSAGIGQTNCTNTVEWSRADAWYEGGWGKVSLGKGDSASRGSDRADLSGTDLIMNYDNRRNRNLTYFVENGGSAGITYGQTFLMYEGQRSQNRARYDSPVFAGVQIKASTANNEKYAIGATWATKEDSNFQVRVAAGYTDLDNAAGQGIDTMTSISASALLGMGLNFTVGYGSADNAVAGGQDQSNIHGKVGYLFGENIAVAIRYMTGSDAAGVVGLDADSIGLSAQWTANDWLDVYGGLEVASAEQGGVSSADMTIGTVGLKVSF
jgi:hypothetical protein